MSLTTENILLIGSILLFVSLIAGKTSYKVGVPVLILFITIGMLAGSEGIGKIQFDSPKTAQFIGIVALNFILFSGGLDTNWQTIKPVLWQGISLSTIGVLLTAALVGVFVWAVTDFTIFEGLLLGAIVSSTDSAAVFSILRSKNLALKGNVRPLLELESGSNDPMAYILTILFTGVVVNQNSDLISIIPLFLRQLLLGGLLGFAFGKIGTIIINKIRLDYEGLYIVLVIAIMFFSFSATNFVGGNGFLAVYLCAVILGNQELIHKKKILKSFDSFAWLMQIVLFLTLGLLVFPSQIVPVIGIGLAISMFLIFLARPISVFLCLIPFRVQARSIRFISWVGLRGAVPIVFATYPMLAGADKATMIFNIVFFISITSVLIQGTTLVIFAKWLNMALPEKAKPITEIDKLLMDLPKSCLREFEILSDFLAVNKRIVDLNFPTSAVILLIKRNEEYIRPGGLTKIEAKDVLIVLADRQEDFTDVTECLCKPNNQKNLK